MQGTADRLPLTRDYAVENGKNLDLTKFPETIFATIARRASVRAADPEIRRAIAYTFGLALDVQLDLLDDMSRTEEWSADEIEEARMILEETANHLGFIKFDAYLTRHPR